MGYYYHPIHGPHQGDPIGGAESTALTEAEYLAIQADRAAYEAAQAAQAEAARIAAIPLGDLAAAKLAAVNAAKNVALDGGFWHGGVLWDSDSKARLAYLELATQIQMDPTFSTAWKASTGNWVTMDMTMFAALIPVYRAHVQSCFEWQAARELEVAAALAMVTPILDENGEETGAVDESAARAALIAVAEAI